MRIQKYGAKLFAAMRTLLIAIVIFSLSGAFASCGRKAAPKYPELFSPAPVAFFKALGTVEGVQLQWQAPQRMANGDPLSDLRKFRVYRAELIDESDPDFDTLVDIEYTGPQLEELTEEQKRDTFKALSAGREKKSKPKTVVVSYLDSTTEPGKRYLYRVVPYGKSRVPGVESPTLLVTFVGEASQVELYVQ